MANRLIKDAKDLKTNELVYFRGHAKATYMSDGRTVEDAVNSMSGGSGSDMTNYYTKEQIDAKGYLTSVPSEYVTETELNNKGYATSSQLNAKQDTISDLATIRSNAEKGATALQSVPSEYVTETELNSKGYLTSIPSEYVTETELNNKGYLTSIPSEYVTETELNNKSYATTTQVNAKQDTLVSGTNIKTVNGTTILGSGDIKTNKPLQTSTSTSMTLTPNVYHRNTSTSLSSLRITLGSVTDDTILNEYLVEFTTRSSGTTITLPSGIKWVGGKTPTFNNGSTYQISIVNNLGVVTEFK